MSAINGAVLLLAIALAAAVIAVVRETRRLPARIEDALARPAPAKSGGGHVRQCNGPCGRRIYLPFGDPNVGIWYCMRCLDKAIAQAEKDFAS